MSRPRKDIDKQQFEKLCGLQCTEQEICSWFGVTDKTLNAWCKRTYHAGFSEIFRQKRGLGKISLRRAQFRLAEKSATMAIFLGKQYLGQTDVQEIKATVTDNPFAGLSTEELRNVIDSG
nr:MAG TPA: putative terminase small subunit [Caudoviricetes sp.]